MRGPLLRAAVVPLLLLCCGPPAGARDSRAVSGGALDGDWQEGRETPRALEVVATWLSGLLYLNPRFGGRHEPKPDWETPDSQAVVVPATAARARPAGGDTQLDARRPPKRRAARPPPLPRAPPPPPDRSSEGWPLTIARNGAEGDAAELRRAERSTEAAAVLPKVALLFLTRGDLPYEETWRLFLEGLPLPGAGGRPGWERAFALHVHPSAGHAYPPGSLFHGRAIAQREKVEWGQWSVMQAERNLMAAALGDAAAQRFVLLSESCIPLYPAALVWAQLLAEPRSRVHACAAPGSPDDEARRMTYRMVNMEREGLELRHWRKSGQWVALNRPHAQLVVNDTLVSRLFREECWVDAAHLAKGEPLQRFCVADEHYIPTLLAFHGMEEETDCTGAATNAWWDGPYFHPRTWEDGEVSMQLLGRLRKSNHGFEPSDSVACEAQDALASAPAVFAALAQPAPGQQGQRQQAVEHAKLKQQGSSRRLVAAQAGAAGQLARPEELWMRLAVTQPGSLAWRRLLGLSAEPGEAWEGAAAAALAQAGPAAGWRRLSQAAQAGGGDGEGGLEGDWVAQALQQYRPMADPNCPLFARKFSPGAAGVVANITRRGFAAHRRKRS